MVDIDITSGDGASNVLATLRTYAPTVAIPAGQAWTLHLRTVQYSLAQLNSTKARITTQEPWAGLSAKYLTEWYVDPQLDKVVVGVTDVTPPLVSAAAHAFGDQVELVHGYRSRVAGMRHYKLTNPHIVHVKSLAKPSAHAPLVATDSRQLDSIPYIGGDDIVSLTPDPADPGEYFVTECTAGYSWATPNSDGTYNQNAAMVTAGHCFPQGTNVQQGYVDEAANTVITTGSIGTVYTVQWGNQRPDAELMNGSSYAPSVWRTQTSLAGVDQTASVVEGQEICADGGLTGENCSGVVGGVNVCHEVIYDSNGNFYNVCGLDDATSNNGTVMVDPNDEGDSGGPVYTLDSSGGLIANGLICSELEDNPDGTASGKSFTFTDLYYLGYIIPGAASS